MTYDDQLSLWVERLADEIYERMIQIQWYRREVKTGVYIPRHEFRDKYVDKDQLSFSLNAGVFASRQTEAFWNQTRAEKQFLGGDFYNVLHLRESDLFLAEKVQNRITQGSIAVDMALRTAKLISMNDELERFADLLYKAKIRQCTKELDRALSPYVERVVNDLKGKVDWLNPFKRSIIK